MPNALVATQSGWAEDEDTLEETKKRTHDALIEQLGEQRTSGITWHIFDGENAMATLEDLIALAFEADDQELLSFVYRPIRGLLREKGGYLVIAMADVAT